MAKPLKKREPHRHADRFYEYLIDHKGEVLRYAAAALVTALIQFFIRRLVPGANAAMIAFAVRFFLLFYALKYWAYREIGSGAFYTGRQMMLAVMLVFVGTLVFNYLTIFAVGLLGHAALVNYVMQALLEIFYFVVYQFLIFKEPKND